MNVDPALEAVKKQRLQGGLSRAVGVPRGTIAPNPSAGGSRGYDVHFRSSEIVNAQLGLPTEASGRSIRRWMGRLVPMVMTGNVGDVKIRGLDLYHLVMYRMIFPKASADEIRRFIFSANLWNPQIFSRVDITRTENILELSRKRASTTAYQALHPRNLLRRFLFWSQPLPIGIAGVPVHVLFDVDECALYTTSANRRFGKSLVGVSINEVGPYGSTDKWTLILGVDSWTFSHSNFRNVAGTTAQDFFFFVQGALARFAALGVRRIWLMDNLPAHFSPAIITAIYAAGHHIVPRAAYYPVDGPIEYVFNHVEIELRKRLYMIRTSADLVFHVNRIIGALGNFRATYNHVGY